MHKLCNHPALLHMLQTGILYRKNLEVIDDTSDESFIGQLQLSFEQSVFLPTFFRCNSRRLQVLVNRHSQ